LRAVSRTAARGSEGRCPDHPHVKPHPGSGRRLS
jgi:hypothetical protein